MAALTAITTAGGSDPTCPWVHITNHCVQKHHPKYAADTNVLTFQQFRDLWVAEQEVERTHSSSEEHSSPLEGDAADGDKGVDGVGCKGGGGPCDTLFTQVSLSGYIVRVVQPVVLSFLVLALRRHLCWHLRGH